MAYKKPKYETLAFIPVREGSKRIPKKNLRKFCGKTLLAYPIEDAIESPHITRIIVSTESEKLAKHARAFGAQVPFLRPKKFASDTSDVKHSLRYTLEKLKKDEGYVPDRVVILQTTSPLRVPQDIEDCIKLMDKTNATTVLTIAPTHPKLYRLDAHNNIKLINGTEQKTSRTQAWPKAYLLNGCAVYVVDTQSFLKQDRIITKKTKAIVMPKWRSVDLDEPEDWAIAELLCTHRNALDKNIKSLI